MIIKTLNSTYEADFAESLVRRVDGVNPSALQRSYGVEDGEWVGFAEAKRLDYGDVYVWYFVLSDGGYLRTSVVVEEIESESAA